MEPAAANSVTCEPFVYASLRTPFGTGYHAVVKGESLGRHEGVSAALFQPLMRLAETELDRPAHGLLWVEGPPALAVAVRLTPQADWQGRPGTFVSALAVRADELLRTDAATLLAENLDRLPFLTPDRLRALLQQQPNATAALALKGVPLRLPSPLARADEAQLLRADAPALVAAAEALEHRSLHFPQQPEPWTLLRALAQLLPPAERARLTCFTGLQHPLPLYGRLNCWHGAVAETPSATQALHQPGASPATPAGQALAGHLGRVLAVPGADAGRIFGRGAGAREWYWDWAVHGERYAAVGPETPLEELGPLPAARALAALHAAGRAWESPLRRWAAVSPVFPAMWAALRGLPAVHAAALAALTGGARPFRTLCANPALPRSAQVHDLLEAALARETPPALAPEEVTAFLDLPPEPRRHWLERLAQAAPAALLAEPRFLHGLLAGEFPTLLPALGRTLLEQQLRAPEPARLTALLRHPAVFAHLRPGDAQRLPPAADPALAGALDQARTLPPADSLAWLEALWARADAFPAACKVTARRLAAWLHELPPEPRVTAAALLRSAARRLGPGQADWDALLADGQTSLAQLPPREARAALEALTDRPASPGTRPPARPVKGPPAWLWPAVGGGALLLVAAGAFLLLPKAPPAPPPPAPTPTSAQTTPPVLPPANGQPAHPPGVNPAETPPTEANPPETATAPLEPPRETPPAPDPLTVPETAGEAEYELWRRSQTASPTRP